MKAPMARDCPCADCGVVMEHVNCLSFYFARPLCTACYREESQRSKRDAEIYILEQMFTRSAA